MTAAGHKALQALRLIQYLDDRDRPCVGCVDANGTGVRQLAGHQSMYALACACIAASATLEAVATAALEPGTRPYAELLGNRRMLPPLTHPDPAHCLVSGTGLTHLGSAATRDAMHQKLARQDEPLSDSMQMFKRGIDGGRPSGNEPGVQPEWFYKGNGHIVVGCGWPLVAPAFALDSGEEPELVGLYVNAPDGRPHRLGFAIGNEFSDHVTERTNYLYLAHSKLRQCAVGPELRTGPLPAHLEGFSRIRRGETLRWEKPFLTGEANMCHSLANLEYHHFKYAAHRRPGDVHLHFLGTATLSFADNIHAAPGDIFEIDLPLLGAPLANPLAIAGSDFGMRDLRAL